MWHSIYDTRNRWHTLSDVLGTQQVEQCSNACIHIHINACMHIYVYMYACIHLPLPPSLHTRHAHTHFDKHMPHIPHIPHIPFWHAKQRQHTRCATGWTWSFAKSGTHPRPLSLNRHRKQWVQETTLACALVSWVWQIDIHIRNSECSYASDTCAQHLASARDWRYANCS